MDKKYIIIILIAILGLIFWAVDKSNRNKYHVPTEINKQIIEEQVDTKENDANLDNKNNMPSLTPIPKEDAQKEITKIRNSIKQTSPQKVEKKDLETPIVEVKTKKENQGNINTTNSNNLTQDNIEEGVVIPVSYTSKNTYKYVYTPSNFNK